MQTRHTAELVPAATEGRDEFTTVELAIDLDGAEKAVRSAINGLATSSTEEGLKFRTTDGMLVAVLGDGESARESVRSSLVYRTAPASIPATLKANRIRRVLQPYQV